MPTPVPDIPSIAIVESLAVYMWLDNPTIDTEALVNSHHMQQIICGVEAFESIVRGACDSAIDYCTCELIATTGKDGRVDADTLARRLTAWIRGNIARHFEVRNFEDVPSATRMLLDEVAAQQRGRTR